MAYSVSPTPDTVPRLMLDWIAAGIYLPSSGETFEHLYRPGTQQEIEEALGASSSP